MTAPVNMVSINKTKNFFKPFAFLAGLSFCTITGSGQFLFTMKKHIVTSFTTIDKYEGIQRKDSIPYADIRIIDSRYDTTNIGFLLDGYLVLRDSSHLAGLQHILDKYYRPLYQAGRDTLIIQLEKLRIQDEVIRDTAFIFTLGYIHASLYTGRNNSYKYLGMVDTLFQEKFNRQTTSNAHKNGKHHNDEFWDYYLLRLYEAMINKGSAGPDSSQNEITPTISREEIISNGLAKRNKPILKADSLHPGFYRDFSEFVNNNPTFLFVNPEALKNTLEVMHYRVGKNISNEAPDTTYWGFCVGRKIFIRHNYDFFQLERRDGGYYIAPTLDARRQEINQSALNLLIGLAALGGSIAANSSPEFGGFSALPAPEIPMVILKSRDELALGLQLDWDTGGIIY